MFKLMDKKNFVILRKLFLLKWPYGTYDKDHHYRSGSLTLAHHNLDHHWQGVDCHTISLWIEVLLLMKGIHYYKHIELCVLLSISFIISLFLQKDP